MDRILVIAWLTKKTTKEILKGFFQAVKEYIDGLLIYLNTRKDTHTTPNRTINRFPTAQEIEKQMEAYRLEKAEKYKKEKEKANQILRGNR